MRCPNSTLKNIEIRGARVKRRLNGHIVTVIMPERRITSKQAKAKIARLMA